MGSLGPRRLQLRGLCSLTLLYTAMGLALPWLQQHPAVFLTFFASTFFASNIGPNSTTFVLPSLTFPQNVRSTFSGASAALGKLGALLGTLAFAPFSSSWGVEPVLVICGAISAISAVVTWALVSPRVGEGQTLSNMYKEQETAEGMAHEAAQESGDPEVDEEGIGDERPTAPLMQTHRQAHH
jgi:PHS family inorganic phosphate transporter-like MFS transporter